MSESMFDALPPGVYVVRGLPSGDAGERYERVSDDPDEWRNRWASGRDAVVALTRTMQQGFQSRMHEQATFAAIDGALQALIANTEDLEPGETNGR